MSSIPPQRARVLKATIDRLERENETLREEVQHLKQQLYTGRLPERVRTWMREYDLPIWEAFYCHEHKKFFTELDSAFPHHMEDCVCDDCDF